MQSSSMQLGRRPVAQGVHQRGIVAQIPNVVTSRKLQQISVPHASSGNEGPSSSGSSGPEDVDQLKQKFFSTGAPEPAPPAQPAPSTQGSPNALDNVNPLVLGRAARRAFDNVWSSISNLASPTRSYIIDDVLQAGEDSQEFDAPQAAYTTVLVVGATGRVGRILTRKLLLRGYKVKALVRNKEAKENMMVPQAVDVVVGDVGESKDCQEAVRGVQKVIYCAGARTTFTADLLRVEDKGVMNIVKAMQDEFVRQSQQGKGKQRRRFAAQTKKEIADFTRRYHQERWDITFVGLPESAGSSNVMSERMREMAAQFRDNVAIAEINDENNLIFEGTLRQRGAMAEVGAKLNQLLPGGEHRTKETEGLVMRIRGDGNQYTCVLTTKDGSRYLARFPTRSGGHLTVRLPYSAFRPEPQGGGALASADFEPGTVPLPSAPLIPELIESIAIRFENRRSSSVAAARSARGLPSREAAGTKREQDFQLEIDWIKALPAGAEPDVILVSCAGSGHTDFGGDDSALAKLVEYKRKGEDNLRMSGLGYSIIRPGKLVQEPGGYKALVFDQGNHITESISAADVADICLRALHEPEARNKTFDVCYELQAEEDLALYELVANVPDKSKGYLRAAVSTLQKNT